MGQDSKIEWCHHTFNPWIGCTKVSEGCQNCYAETLMDKRYHKTKWGPNGLRVVKADAGWREPAKWNKAAAEAGEIHRVFCASLADVGEGPETMPDDAWQAVQAARQRLVETFSPLSNLVLLMLTKRPENLPKLFPADFLARCWVGTSVEDQKRADERIPHMLRCPAAVRFLSVEPLLGQIGIFGPCKYHAPIEHDGIPPIDCCACDGFGRAPLMELADRVHWVIVGGESGHGARMMHPDWARAVRDQCQAAGVAFFFKQWGEYSYQPAKIEERDHVCTIDRDGRDWALSMAGGKVCHLGPDANLWTLDQDSLPVDGLVEWRRVGKKAAGRLLDGVEWNQMPTPAGTAVGR